MKKLIFIVGLLIAITSISSYAQRDDNDNSPYAPIYLTFTSINVILMSEMGFIGTLWKCMIQIK